VQIAGFTRDEADRLFGRPPHGLVPDLSIRLRPPVQVRADYTARYQQLLAEIDA
jgi:hypothetical protein